MARFRNRVVHLFDEVDTGDVYQYENEGISDFNSFIDDINKLLTLEEKWLCLLTLFIVSRNNLNHNL